MYRNSLGFVVFDYFDPAGKMVTRSMKEPLIPSLMNGDRNVARTVRISNLRGDLYYDLFFRGSGVQGSNPDLRIVFSEKGEGDGLNVILRFGLNLNAGKVDVISFYGGKVSDPKELSHFIDRNSPSFLLGSFRPLDDSWMFNGLYK